MKIKIEQGKEAVREFELFVFDLDGTLVDSTLRLSEGVRSFLASIRGEGKGITIATGRTFKAASPFIDELGIELPVILYNGAVIMDPKTKLILYERRIPRGEAEVALRILADFELHPELYLEPTDDIFYAPRITPPIADFMAKDKIPGKAVGDLLSFLGSVNRDPIKVLIIGEREELVRFKEQFLAARPRAAVVFSESNYLEILPLEASKGRALKRLCDLLGIPPAKTVAFGNNMNDAEMLEIAGLGIAMSTAPEELKDKADLVINSVDELLADYHSHQKP